MGSSTALPVPPARKPYPVTKKKLAARKQRELEGPHKLKLRQSGGPGCLSHSEWKKVMLPAILCFFTTFNLGEDDVDKLVTTFKVDESQRKAIAGRLCGVVDNIQRDVLIDPRVSKPIADAIESGAVYIVQTLRKRYIIFRNKVFYKEIGLQMLQPFKPVLQIEDVWAYHNIQYYL